MTCLRRAAIVALLPLLLIVALTPVAAQEPQSSGPAVSETQAPAAIPPTTATTDAAAPAKGSVQVGIHDLSPWSMFLSADIVVKAIMIGLAFASLLTWTIFVAKFLELSIVQRRLAQALKATAQAGSLQQSLEILRSDKSVLRSFMATAINEVRVSAGIDNDAGIKERAASRFSEVTRTEARRIRVGMGLLATIGATSPFVGLFGTVWGIMNSFIGISKTQTTNLAVVAPGIAEALLATAIGLVAAIPAVIIYNHFSRMTKGYMDLVGKASGATGRQLSRDLDRLQGAHLRRAAE
ncbi:tonB-system energizer ExbB [Bradyrhizobium sp. LHD-71]|uniref:tonB-system energizer ExbB n=1 Tax=Bradyrhizobium sp. LHD-71 TaxID=3072141 RepID=UPI00280DC09B|nr:tonB-system energizer ExbB [Bradyrhizobium sp. LHD-71]MDQ8728692.1 tonB-system energizer ExbB [Bradyrhizobium sp. LHD-71]